jgi:sortase A
VRKAEPTPRKRSAAIALCLGLVILGIGCVGWALVSIRLQSVPADTYRSSSKPALQTVSQATGPNEKRRPNPKQGERFGSLSIPKLEQKLPIVQGTGTDDLKKGVGHFIQSVMPGVADNCVLSGHRDTVFAQLGKLKHGDQFIVQTSAGTFTYEIKRIRIVDADDRTVIVPTDHAVLTVTTCYPFSYVGSAPDRYILSADLVASE